MNKACLPRDIVIRCKCGGFPVEYFTACSTLYAVDVNCFDLKIEPFFSLRTSVEIPLYTTNGSVTGGESLMILVKSLTYICNASLRASFENTFS
ncbi:hypothetical protein AR158_c125R [Paramecium bursaria Chlorella virus AR158]|uniref:hypothetical protein n=1 Tax=Paramecium bursaria Chlorella virus AR158 TaxID=380598 RepID=UPI00015AA7E2|nr:hypothetical protein AR158_c125R [Paramecium bursaria Chlorella virus AR158]ABU43671.1 hypothetical protein AR158_c125R [Paramecium bursaria Chlorella virus AR158]